MAERIPQSTAIRVPLQAYLSTDHVSNAVGKTIAITLSKNGAAYGNPSAGATVAVEVANGSYYVDLGTTDTGTLGPLWVRGTSAGVDDVIAIYTVAGPPQDSAGTTTLLSRLTNQRALNLDLIDTEVSSRLSSSMYTPPMTSWETQEALLDACSTPEDFVQASPAPAAGFFAGSSAMSSVDDWYVGGVVVFETGALEALARRITGYSGSTRTFTFAVAWPAAPAVGDGYRVLGRID